MHDANNKCMLKMSCCKAKRSVVPWVGTPANFVAYNVARFK